MSDIFLSYAREDLEAAKPLVTALETQQWSVFWDRHIPAGRGWRDVLEQILPSVECIVVLWSRNSVKSDWVLEEAEYGRSRHVLIPVLIDTATPPLGFRNIQSADLSGWTGDNRDSTLQQFLQDVTSILKEIAKRKQRRKNFTRTSPRPSASPRNSSVNKSSQKQDCGPRNYSGNRSGRLLASRKKE
jgi:TIR domain